MQIKTFSNRGFGVACASVAISALLAGAARAGEVEIERMTTYEVGGALDAGKTTIIIPTGGTEQNGRHMVTGKHNFIVAEAARRIAAALGDALVAPVIAYVPEGNAKSRTGHMAYPGTITVPDEIYAKLLEAAALSFKVHGFKTIVFLGDSGGNQQPQAEVARALSAAWSNEGVRVVNAWSYYGENGGDEWLKSQGESAATIGTHAGIRDTSELLAVYRAGVRPGAVKVDADGATGDPARATKERGETLLALKVEAAIRDIRAVQAGTSVETPKPGVLARLVRWLMG